MGAKKTVLVLIIAVLLVFFIGYGLETFYPGPVWEDFCDEDNYKIAEPTRDPGEIPEQDTCYEELDTARESYDRNVFFILGIIGVAAVLFGIKGPKLRDYVAAGVMGGGLLTLFYGMMRYWGHLSDVIRFVFIGVILFLFIYIGNKYKRFFK